MSSYDVALAGPADLPTLAPHLSLPAGVALPAGLGGTPVSALCLELLRRGLRVLLVTLCAQVKGDERFTGPQLTVRVGPYRPRPRHRALDAFAIERNYVARALRAEAPPVAHAHWSYEFALGALASGVPTVVTAHDAPINVLRLHRHAYRAIRAGMAYAALRRAPLVTAVSPYVADHLRRYRFVRSPACIVPNGLPEDLFGGEVRLPRQDRARAPVFACCLVGWSGRKNGEVALHAFAQVRAAIPGAQLRLFGGGHGPGEEAQHWAQMHGLTDGVEFVGQVPHAVWLEQLRDEVDVLVHPSLEESHGLVLVEAMALGVPVIGGVDSGAVPWTLDQGRGGVLVNVRDPNALAGAMLRLATDAPHWEVQRSGGAACAQRFRIGEVADAYLDCYRRVRETG